MDYTIDIGPDGKSAGPLQGAPQPGAQFAMAGVPVTSAVAYGMSHSSNMMSPFAADPEFIAFNSSALARQMRRFAEAVRKNPDAPIYVCQMHQGDIQIFLGQYGNCKSSVSLGAVKGTRAINQAEMANLTMAEMKAKGVKFSAACGAGGGGAASAIGIVSRIMSGIGF